MSLVDRVRSSVHACLEGLARAGELPDPNWAAASWSVDRAKRPEHGDFATNAAMVLAKRAGVQPRQLAERIVRALATSDVIRSADVAGPGFVNLRVHASAVHAELRDVLRAGSNFGRAPAASGERINIEFVSANP